MLFQKIFTVTGLAGAVGQELINWGEGLKPVSNGLSCSQLFELKFKRLAGRKGAGRGNEP